MSADFEGKKAFPTNFSKVRHQAYSTIEYEIYTILKQTNNTEENEEHLHKDEQDMSEETTHHVSTSLSNFQRETLETLLKDSRRYNLDLAPKIMPCRGELIELLISSGVGRYLEFKALDRTYIYSDQDNFDKVYFYYQSNSLNWYYERFTQVFNNRFHARKKMYLQVKQYLWLTKEN